MYQVRENFYLILGMLFTSVIVTTQSVMMSDVLVENKQTEKYKHNGL